VYDSVGSREVATGYISRSLNLFMVWSSDWVLTLMLLLTEIQLWNITVCYSRGFSIYLDLVTLCWLVMRDVLTPGIFLN
jgi:hypothetical protein